MTMSSKTIRSALAASLGTLALLAGCGSGTEPTPIPSLVGEYDGTWTQDLAMDGQPVSSVVCPCTLTVPSQTGNSFYGRSTLSEPCTQGLLAGNGRATLSIAEGRIEPSGTVSFRFSEDPRVGLSGGGCTVTAMDAFTGTLSGRTLTAARSEGYDCTAADGHRYALTVRLVASRR